MSSLLPTTVLGCLLAMGCAAGIGSTDSEPDEPDAGTNKRDDPEPGPDAAIDYPCTGGTTNFEDPSSGHCYMFFADKIYWQNANSNCEQLDGDTHLAVIGDDAENSFVLSAIGGADAWLGGTDEAAEGSWSWVTAEAFSYLNWRSGEPNNGNGNEDCVVIEGGRGGTWDDRNCTDKQKYVCEREY